MRDEPVNVTQFMGAVLFGVVDVIGVERTKDLLRSSLADDRMWKMLEIAVRNKEKHVEMYLDEVNKDMAVADLWKPRNGSS